MVRTSEAEERTTTGRWANVTRPEVIGASAAAGETSFSMTSETVIQITIANAKENNFNEKSEKMRWRKNAIIL